MVFKPTFGKYNDFHTTHPFNVSELPSLPSFPSPHSVIDRFWLQFSFVALQHVSSWIGLRINCIIKNVINHRDCFRFDFRELAIDMQPVTSNEWRERCCFISHSEIPDLLPSLQSKFLLRTLIGRLQILRGLWLIHSWPHPFKVTNPSWCPVPLSTPRRSFSAHPWRCRVPLLLRLLLPNRSRWELPSHVLLVKTILKKFKNKFGGQKNFRYVSSVRQNVAPCLF